MIERVNELVARRCGGVGTTAGSLVRIHIWAVVFLAVISLVLPARTVPILHPHKHIHRPVDVLTLQENDPRAYAPSRYKKGHYRIVWLSASEGASDFAPLGFGVVDYLSTVDRRKVAIDVYLRSASRVTDLYFELLDAIATKPDMIVISLNPVFVLYPFATHQWGELDSSAAVDLLTKPDQWTVGAAFLSPSDLAWGVASSAFPPVKDRFDYGANIHDLVDGLGPLDRSGLRAATAAQKPDLQQQVLAMVPADFWTKYRLHEREPLTPGDWARVVASSNHGQSGLNKIVLRAMAAALRDSKIPSYVYAAPVNSQWLATNRRLDTAVRGVEAQLQKLSGDFSARNILYQPLNASRFLPPMQFYQIVHLGNAEPLFPYLASQLCRLATQVGQSSSCHATKQGSR